MCVDWGAIGATPLKEDEVRRLLAECAAARPHLQSFLALRYGRSYAGALVSDVLERDADKSEVKRWVEAHDGWEEGNEIPPEDIGWGRSWRRRVLRERYFVLPKYALGDGG